jgi:AcrR family transcriptional regulator
MEKIESVGAAAPTWAPKIKERQWRLREAAILDAASDLLATKGYEAMTLGEVVAEVGISRPTLYQHFSSKEDLGAKVLQRAMCEAEDNLTALAAALPPREAAVAMIRWVVERQFGQGSAHDFAGGLCLFSVEGVRSAEARLTLAFARVVERAKDDGSVRISASPRLIAQTLLSVLKDTVYEDAFRKGRLDVEALKADLVQLLIG